MAGRNTSSTPRAVALRRSDRERQARVVPNIMVGGSNGGGTGGMVEMLLAMLVAEKIEKPKPEAR